jgi:hypothetical protein
MTIINDSDNLAESLLENWGNWCYSNPYSHLGYSKQPIFDLWRAPGGEKRRPSKPVVERDALVANAAILHIRLKECPFDAEPRGFFSLYGFIVEKWAKKQPNRALRDYYKCHRNTITNRADRAREVFMEEYLKIVRDANRLNKLNSSKG